LFSTSIPPEPKAQQHHWDPSEAARVLDDPTDNQHEDQHALLSLMATNTELRQAVEARFKSTEN
jgi:hypothetical protein